MFAVGTAVIPPEKALDELSEKIPAHSSRRSAAAVAPGPAVAAGAAEQNPDALKTDDRLSAASPPTEPSIRSAGRADRRPSRPANGLSRPAGGGNTDPPAASLPPPAAEDNANAALTHAYLGRLAGGRRLSPHTVAGYGRDLARLRAVAAGRPFAAVAPADIRRKVAELSAAGLSGRSLARLLSAWRGFYRWLAREHGVTANPLAGLKAPRSARRLPRALSPDAAAQLMGPDTPAATPLRARDKAMFELLYSSGLRLAELTGLNLADLDRAEGVVRVTGKGAKTRLVPVGAKAWAALDDWQRARALLARAEPAALFLSERGTRLSPRAVQVRLAAWALRHGVHDAVHPHVLRHSFASHVLQSSGDLRAVQEMLGHASIASTQVYTHLDFQHLAKVYDAAHPRARRQEPGDKASDEEGQE